eukprot:gene47717-3740_t
MPVVEISEPFDAGVDEMFRIVFGSEFFVGLHAADGHTELRCSGWAEDASGQRRRDAAYTLPEAGALKMLRQGPTRVTVAETVRREHGGYVIVSIADNSGGTLAEATKVTATYTLSPAGVGTLFYIHVDFSFSAPRLLRGVIEAAMFSEMRDGYGKLVAFARQTVAARAGTNSPSPPPTPPDRPPARPRFMYDEGGGCSTGELGAGRELVPPLRERVWEHRGRVARV